MQNIYLKYFKVSPYPSLLLKPAAKDSYLIEDVNHAFLRLLGGEKKDLIGKDYIKSFYSHHEDRLNISASILKTSLEYVKTYRIPKKIEKFHFELETADGLVEEYAWEIENIPILDQNSELKYILQVSKELLTVEENITFPMESQLDFSLMGFLLGIFRQEQELEASLGKALKLVGEELDVERAYYFVNGQHPQSGKPATSQQFEWAKDSYWDESENMVTQNLLFEEIEDLIEPLVDKDFFCRNISGLRPGNLKDILDDQKIKSIFILPLYVQNNFHGFIGFDDCVRERDWSPKEKEFLKCFASLVANEIEKNLKLEMERFGLTVREDLAPFVANSPEAVSFGQSGTYRFYETIVEHGAELISIIDEAGLISFMSGNLKRLLGWKVERILGKVALMLVHPADRFRVMKKLVFIKPLQQTKFSPFRVKDHLGFWKWVEGTAINLSKDSQVQGTILHMRDVTDLVINNQKLKISNERFKFAMMATNEMIWDWDLSKDKVTRSKGFQKLLGTELQPDIKGWLWLKFIHQEDIKMVKKRLQEVMQDQDCHHWKLNYRLVKENGQVVYVEDRGYVLRDDAGNAVRMVGATADVTQSTKLMGEVKLQNAQLKEIAHVQSHHVRAPLARILGLVDMLDQDLEEGIDNKQELRDVLEFISDSAKELDKVIQEVIKKSEEVRGI
ncbi:PAS domain-containing protein [Litoribacter ruber]|uniref:PAS domain-containing protein n=1 Tax=Litoribacter ruber TaxID=702568 RepID=UPI001BDA1424|nr:PAS domain-containing protein [Litoribacter ruber]MBT0811532.1 PAS domain-containing protein [Litoribacter ruber]